MVRSIDDAQTQEKIFIIKGLIFEGKTFEEMAMKTVVKKMLKWLPISIEMIENLRKDNATFKMNEETKEVTGNYNDDLFGDAEVIDESTGEIIKKDGKDNDVIDIGKDDVAETLFDK